MKVFLVLLATIAFLKGSEIRVATFNVLTGIEAPGTTSHDSVKAVLARINADVVGLQEVTGADRSGNPSNIESLATSLGYPHVFIPSGIALDTNSRVILLSKFPFTSTHSIGSPQGAKDVVRAHAAALIDVPGTEADPMIITLHLKCCFDFDDFFRRAVEMERLKLFLDDQSLTGSDNIIIMGDYNLLGSNSTYESLPSGLPSTYVLGSDISFPLSYFSNPASYLTAYPLLNPQPRQQDGVKSGTHSGGSTLDYMMLSQALIDRSPVLEIYTSEFESNHPGLPKFGQSLAFSVSDNASDHLPIFGDFDLEAGSLPLSITVAPSSITEGGAPATATITLPSPPATGETVTVLLASSDCEEAMPTNLTLTFTAGVTTQSTPIIPQADSIIDGSQLVILTASATGFLGATTSLTVLDQDTPTYLLTAFNEPVLEEFTGYRGEQTAARWTSSDSNFQGLDDGSSSARGPRSYGVNREGSLGILTGEEVLFTSNYENTTGSEITSLNIAYSAEQWQSFLNGGQDQLEVSLITPGGTSVIPDLYFTAASNLPTGPITNGTSSELDVTLTGLAIPAAAQFQVQFRTIPGAPGTTRGDIAFINEFHYDNSGGDQGEFVEIILGPTFGGTIADLSLHFYNGANGAEYMTHDFTASDLDQTLPSGHRIYSVAISGIQNGAPDGIVLAHNSNVLQFLSYEGQFTANNGPASEMTSVRIGPSQSSAPSPGTGSLGLSGEGAGPDDFTWIKSTGAFTKGAPNDGQTFGTSTQGQGIAIDNLRLTALPPTIGVSISTDFILTFPTETGTSYTVETSTDLINWSVFATLPGDGSPASFDVSNAAPRCFFRIKSSPL
jgi:endonuclease/exonuclease/phosphatase family metal-dependent hydrolase